MVVRKMELESQATEVLKAVGINKGHIALDFGCGSGTYTIPAARLVGEEGKVYALDKDRKALDKLMQKAKSEGLRNIERMDTSGEPRIRLADESVDVVLLLMFFTPTILLEQVIEGTYWMRLPGLRDLMPLFQFGQSIWNQMPETRLRTPIFIWKVNILAPLFMRTGILKKVKF